MLSTAQRKVLAAIPDDNGSPVWLIASRSGLPAEGSEEKTRRAVRRLVELGFAQRDDARHYHSTYKRTEAGRIATTLENAE